MQTNQRQTCHRVQLVKDALKKGDIWQIGVDIAVNSERTTDLRCCFSFLGGGVTALSDFSFLVPRFSFFGGSVTRPLDTGAI